LLVKTALDERRAAAGLTNNQEPTTNNLTGLPGGRLCEADGGGEGNQGGVSHGSG
jgi:hypothetical protein